MRAEIKLVRDENLRLRMERQRALSSSRGAERIEQLRSALVEADENDDLWQALAHTTAIRDNLLAACTELRLTIAAIERQLADTTPAQELDRRVEDRRADGARNDELDRASR